MSKEAVSTVSRRAYLILGLKMLTYVVGGYEPIYPSGPNVRSRAEVIHGSGGSRPGFGLFFGVEVTPCRGRAHAPLFSAKSSGVLGPCLERMAEMVDVCDEDANSSCGFESHYAPALYLRSRYD